MLRLAVVPHGADFMNDTETQAISQASSERPLAARQHERAKVRCRVVWDHTGRRSSNGEILDISPAGLFMAASEVELPVALKNGNVVWGQFDIGEEAFPFSAIVRWRGMSPAHGCEGVGLEFTDLSQIPSQKLEVFLSANSLAPGSR